MQKEKIKNKKEQTENTIKQNNKKTNKEIQKENKSNKYNMKKETIKKSGEIKQARKTTTNTHTHQKP